MITEDNISLIIQEHITLEANCDKALTRYRHLSASEKIFKLFQTELLREKIKVLKGKNESLVNYESMVSRTQLRMDYLAEITELEKQLKEIENGKPKRI